ncbi:hypothetical protein [Burkholderia sp. WP9]|nr:hypothetical protein [Burkholderia sp. WP9]
MEWTEDFIVKAENQLFDGLVARQFLHLASPAVSSAAAVQTLESDSLDRD